MFRIQLLSVCAALTALVFTQRYSLSKLEKIALIVTTTLRCKFGAEKKGLSS